MKLPDKLPKPPKYEGSLCPMMTEEDWIEYFKCREKYDIPMTKEEKHRIIQEANRLNNEGKTEEALMLTDKLPMKPFFAFCIKSTCGLQSLSTFNLYKAKLEYPDEF